MRRPSLTRQKLRAQARRIYRSLYFPPFVILVAMLFVTYWTYRASLANLDQDRMTVIQNRQAEVATTINNRLKAYEQVLIGGSGLFRASSDVTSSEWHDYVSTFDIPLKYPGVQSLGYIRVVTAAQLPELQAYMQAQGFSNFNVRPNTPRELYTLVLYNEPNTRSPGIGGDIYTDPLRKPTMDEARDENKAMLSRPVKALFDTIDQQVFQLFFPQYKSGMPKDTPEQRKTALQGYLYAGFRTRDFFDTLLPTKSTDKNQALEIIESEHSTTSFYQTPNYRELSKQNGVVRATQKLEVYGQIWTVNYVFNDHNLTHEQRRNTPLLTLLAGILLSLLLAQVIFLLLKARAQDLAAQRDRAVDLAKDELLSLASHQLRTPATTVKQYLGMVLQGFAGVVTDTQEGLLQKAYAGNERQLRIINEMLHVAKIDSGRITLAKQNTNLNSLLKEIVNDFKSDITDAGHTIKLSVPKKVIKINVDEHMLRMAVENLISNAIKYTLYKGKIRVSMTKKAGFVYIAVKDNGIGIESSDMERLYQLFTRLNNKLTQTVSGTGVGLYLAKHLIELHGGKITTQSTAGKGSTFTIILPT